MLPKYSSTFKWLIDPYYPKPTNASFFRFAGVPVDFEIVNIDPNSDGNEDLEYAITTIKRNGVAIKGNIETKSEQTGIISRNVALRNELDLYVNVLNCKSYPSVRGRQHEIDIVIVRQNTEGEYAMLEHEVILHDSNFEIQIYH